MIKVIFDAAHCLNIFSLYILYFDGKNLQQQKQAHLRIRQKDIKTNEASRDQKAHCGRQAGRQQTRLQTGRMQVHNRLLFARVGRAAEK